jgi:hypothetical protein
LRELRLRNQRERLASYLPNVSHEQLESTAIRTERSKMTADAKTREDKGDAQNRDQRDLTTRVGTRLERPEKKSRRRLFGRRGTTPTTGS